VSNLLAAIAYTNIGYPVFPIRVNAKTPLTPHGFKEATTDQARIIEWWGNWPDANIGLATGEVSGVSVVDIDGPAGVDSVKMLGLPKTWTVQTPRGTGYHLYFTYTPDLKQAAAVMPGIDIRNDGGYILLPPSYVVDEEKGYEGTYTVRRHVLPAEIHHIPDALTGHQRTVSHVTTSEPRDPTWVSESLGGVPESQRNDTSARLVGYFHRRGLRRDEIIAVMTPFARGCSPPMDSRELETTVDSVLRYPGGSDGLTSRANRPDERNLLL
tara:strand:- start:2186 stop:2992 length:807 start_codon:yes stop_codon:yes gene_type:complete